LLGYFGIIKGSGVINRRLREAEGIPVIQSSGGRTGEAASGPRQDALCREMHV